MFLKNEKYTKFDESGIPTHEKAKEGDKPINEKLKNKLTKEWNAQKEMYEKYIEKYGAPKQEEWMQKFLNMKQIFSLFI